jgi:hypothetical protein
MCYTDKKNEDIGEDSDEHIDIADRIYRLTPHEWKMNV